MMEATSSLEQVIVDRPSMRAGDLLAVPWEVGKQEAKKELNRLALAGVLSAVTDLWVRR